MAWADLLAGFAFYLIIEGLLPFISPRAWRRGLALLSQVTDGQLKVCGLVAVVMGLAILFVVRG